MAYSFLKNYKFSLTNRFNFVVTMFLLIPIFTLINNYFFYLHIKNQAIVDMDNLGLSIDKYALLCTEDKGIPSNKCIENIIPIIDNYFIKYNKSDFTVKNSDNHILYEYNSKYTDGVVTASGRITLSSENTTFNIQKDVKINTPQLLRSVFRSVTFSLPQIIDIALKNGLTEVKSFIILSAIPRSQPTLMYASFLCIIFLIFRRREYVLMKEIQNSEDEKEKAINKYHNLQEKIYGLDEELTKHNRKIEKIKKEQSTAIEKEQDELFEMLFKEENKIKLLEKEKEKMNEDLIQKDKDIDELQIYIEKGNSCNSNNKLKKVLLDNPILVKNNNDVQINKGKHHSKSFVKEVENRLLSNNYLKDYMVSIQSSEYNPKKRTKIVISKNEHNQYIANIYDSNDEGFGVLIVFSTTNLYNTVSLSKFIIHSISYFKKYKIEIKN